MARKAIVPQQERSTETRRRALEATIECLCAVGYAGTTTLAVGERAGLSRGALLYHFPTRQMLVSAAVQQLFSDLRRDFERAFGRLPAGAERSGAAIDLLWKTFQDVRLAAVLELYVAGRTDPELHAQLIPVAEQHHQLVLGLARSFFPEAASQARFTGALDLILDTLQGMAVRKLVRPKDSSPRRTLALLKDLAAAVATA